MTALLAVRGLRARYGPIVAVREANLHVEEGEIVALLGANGAGKTTTLGAIAGLVRAREGEISLAGEDVSRLAPEQIARRGLSLTPEGRRLFATLTVAENLAIGAASLARQKRKSGTERKELLELFPVLAQRLHSPAGTLSGGEQQQLAIARSLMSRPRLLLLDEPTLGLAPKLVRLVFELIGRLRTERGLTVLLVEQYVNGLALGSSYALLALGLAMVFSIMGLINFAHGELLTIGGYTMWVAFEHGVPWPVVIPITLLITSFAVSYFLQTVFQIGINTQPEGIELPIWVNDVAHVGSVAIPIVKLVTAGVTLLALVVLTLFLRRTLLGISMRAAAEDFPVVRLMGVRANGVVVGAFAISGFLAGIAALLFFAQTAAVDSTTGTAPVVKAFIAVILGGLGSLTGAVVGGFVLGFAEVIFQATLPDGVLEFRDAFVLSLLIAILLVRPAGLFGRARGLE